MFPCTANLFPASLLFVGAFETLRCVVLYTLAQVTKGLKPDKAGPPTFNLRQSLRGVI